MPYLNELPANFNQQMEICAAAVLFVLFLSRLSKGLRIGVIIGLCGMAGLALLAGGATDAIHRMFN